MTDPSKLSRDGSESSAGTGLVRTGDQQMLLRGIGRVIEIVILGLVRGVALLRGALRRS